MVRFEFAAEFWLFWGGETSCIFSSCDTIVPNLYFLRVLKLSISLVTTDKSACIDRPIIDNSQYCIATTVASTMTLAHTAGISTFVTGGIGGVHRNGHVSMDVSADLTELSRTPVVVVSAGIKSILDIPRTLEVLETNAVPAVAYQTQEFPCFFSPNSGVMAPARIDSAEQVASAYWASRALHLSNGMLVAVPPPDPAGQAIEEKIQEAVAEAEALGISGQAVTPFILKRIAETTKGDSLRCNISLVKHNAEIGSEIAIAIAEQRNSTAVGVVAPPEYPDDNQRNLPAPARVIVMGGTVLDIVAKPKSELILGTSNPAVCTESDGGVGRNVAEVLGRLGSLPLLYSAVGRDARGSALQQRQEEYGIQDSSLTIQAVDGANTATFLAVLEGLTNDLHTACADMDVMENIPIPPKEVLEHAEMLVLDANPPLTALKEAAQTANEVGVDVFFEPTSVPKARLAARDHEFLRYLNGAFPNLDELEAMRDAACNASLRHSKSSFDKDGNLNLDEVEAMAAELLEYMSPSWAYLVITMGEHGVLLASRGSESDSCHVRHYPPEERVEVQNSTGAGDSLCGAFLHATLQGKDVSEAISLGMMAASISLSSSDRTIASELSALRENTWENEQP